MKKYIMAFVKDEDGMETIEYVIVLAIVAGLIAIISAVGSTVREKATEAEGQINRDLGEINYGSGTNGNTNTTSPQGARGA